MCTIENNYYEMEITGYPTSQESLTGNCGVIRKLHKSIGNL